MFCSRSPNTVGPARYMTTRKVASFKLYDKELRILPHSLYRIRFACPEMPLPLVIASFGELLGDLGGHGESFCRHLVLLHVC